MERILRQRGSTWRLWIYSCLLQSITRMQRRSGPRCIFMNSRWMCLPHLPMGSSPASLPHQPRCSAVTDEADWANCYADEPHSYLSKCSRETSRDTQRWREGSTTALHSSPQLSTARGEPLSPQSGWVRKMKDYEQATHFFGNQGACPWAGKKPYCFFSPASPRKLFKLRPRGPGVSVLIRRRKPRSRTKST